MKKKIIFVILLVVVVYAVFAVLTALSAKKAVAATQKAVGAVKLQDLDATKAYLKDAKKEFEGTKKLLIVFTPLRIVPLVGWYVADAQRGITAAVDGLEAASILTEAITPYADVLGLQGQGTFLGGTAQERIAKTIETLSKVTPQIDQIQSWRYPNILPGKPGAKIDSAKLAVDQLESLVVDTKPLLLVLPEIM